MGQIPPGPPGRLGQVLHRLGLAGARRALRRGAVEQVQGPAAGASEEGFEG